MKTKLVLRCSKAANLADLASFSISLLHEPYIMNVVIPFSCDPTNYSNKIFIDLNLKLAPLK